MKYGFFDDENREYVITNPKTPVKWINYVGTLAFGGLVDHTGGSLICKGDPALNRITKYIPQLPSSDFKGEGLYLRVKDGAGYKVFSPFFVPTLDPYDKYECYVGLGYQRIVSEINGIRTEVTIFVPRGSSVMLRDIKITNIGEQPVALDVIPVVEFTHFDALKQYINADWCPQTMTADAECENGRVLLKQYAFCKKEEENNFFTSNAAVESFQTDRKVFLGENEYGTWKNPLELQNESLSNVEARRGDVIAALLHKLDAIQPGETRRIITQLGQEAPQSVAATVNKYRDESEVDAAFAEQVAFWDEYLSMVQVNTPDAAFNTMVNIHNPRQCHTTLNWSRYLSLYQLGLGARGLGFRDSAQDVMGIFASAPKEGKALMKKLLSVQLPNGSAMHQFFPLTMEANEGDSRHEGDGKMWYGDDHLWIVLAVCAYLKETGDYDFLDEEITFYGKNLPIDRRRGGTVFEHLRRALEFTKSSTGDHGLPLLGFADWNDTVNLPGTAESVFVANLYGRALLEIIELEEYRGNESRAKIYRADHASMAASLNMNAWDGEWYLRYFEQHGEPIGSKKNSEGKIYTNAQSWSVMSGLATPERAEQALNSVNEKLNTKRGIKLSWPGYNGFDESKGGITSYPPGAKENGGIFLHSNPWVMIAETLVGNGDRAFEYYQQINPAAQNDRIEVFECEPYCYPQNILGDEHPQFGLARNSWLSGTSSWTYQAATQYILGVRPQHGGLMIDPCIPRAWDGFSVVRKFRGATFNIAVSNPNHICKGVVLMKVDGVAVDGQLIPDFNDGEHTVEVIMG